MLCLPKHRKRCSRKDAKIAKARKGENRYAEGRRSLEVKHLGSNQEFVFVGWLAMWRFDNWKGRVQPSVFSIQRIHLSYIFALSAFLREKSESWLRL